MNALRNLISYLHRRFFKNFFLFSNNWEAVQANCLEKEQNMISILRKMKSKRRLKNLLNCNTDKSSNTFFFVFIYPICAIFIPPIISTICYFAQNLWSLVCSKQWKSTVDSKFSLTYLKFLRVRAPFIQGLILGPLLFSIFLGVLFFIMNDTDFVCYPNVNDSYT